MTIHNLQDFFEIIDQNKPILGIDYGKKKIGFAISNSCKTIAMPLKIISNKSNQYVIDIIESLIVQYHICAVVIGLPLSLDGSSNDQTRFTEAFAQGLSTICDISIYMQDERFTSKAADNMLKAIDIKRKVRNSIDDSVAACVILNNLLSKLKTNSS
ncbi:MAG: Holliday junction resolvase RuvX [Rickettsiaceae bacterium]